MSGLTMLVNPLFGFAQVCVKTAQDACAFQY